MEIHDAPAAEPPQSPANSESSGGRSAHLAPYRFTSANAALMAQRSREARAQRKNGVAPPSSPGIPASAAEPNERQELVREQIARTRAVLNGRLDPRERAQLLLALDRLLDRERILQGLPLPGSRRPGRDGRKSSGVAQLPDAEPA
jgi:hypothetical protein